MSDETIKDIIDTMDNKQKDVLYYLIDYTMTQVEKEEAHLWYEICGPLEIIKR